MVRGLFRRVDQRANEWLAAMRSTQRAQALGAIGEGSSLAPTTVIQGHACNIELGRGVSVADHVTMDCDTERSRIRIGDSTTILPYAMLLTHGGSISIGEQCSVNPFCMLYGHGGLTIGNCVRIATHVTLIPANHRFDDPNVPVTKQGLSMRGIVIEDDVWIGAGAVVLDGVRIRRGSVVAAGAVVHDDCGPFEVVAGVPAKVIKRRA